MKNDKRHARPRRKPATKTKAKTRSRPRKTAPPPPEETPLLEPPAAVFTEELPVAVEEPPLDLALPLSSPEPLFASRVPPPETGRPMPEGRRAIFFDVENTSRAQHISHVIEHLQIDRRGYRTEFVAVGNWRVIGHDTARLLARHGAHLVHSAPSVGVRDWSDLRIAVTAGAWLASARAGDLIEIVSDDRAFDAVGDVAASLGITFRRLSYRGLAGAPPEPAPARAIEPAEPRDQGGRREPDSRRHRGRYRGRRGDRQQRPAPAPAPVAPAPPPPPVADDGVAAEPHTAPHDEIIGVVRDLMRGSPGRVSIDALANALKSRGFSRPPGSPRLITRLRRIKEIEVSRQGMITLVGAGAAAADARDPDVRAADVPDPEARDAEAADDLAEAEPIVIPIDTTRVALGMADDDFRSIGDDARMSGDDIQIIDDDGPQPGNERFPTTSRPVSTGGDDSRRRRRRGGRRRRGRGGRQPSPAS